MLSEHYIVPSWQSKRRRTWVRRSRGPWVMRCTASSWWLRWGQRRSGDSGRSWPPVSSSYRTPPSAVTGTASRRPTPGFNTSRSSWRRKLSRSDELPLRSGSQWARRGKSSSGGSGTTRGFWWGYSPRSRWREMKTLSLIKSRVRFSFSTNFYVVFKRFYPSYFLEEMVLQIFEKVIIIL